MSYRPRWLRMRRELVHLEVVRIQPGDVIVARTQDRIDAPTAARIKAQISAYIGDNRVIVTDRIDLTVMRPTQGAG